MSASAGNCILAVNRGSSSLKFALFDLVPDGSLPQTVTGQVERIGRADASLTIRGHGQTATRPVTATGHGQAAGHLLDWLKDQIGFGCIQAVGHRVVHGGPEYRQPTLVTPELLDELRKISPYDPEHLPTEIALIEAFAQRAPEWPQVACFDTGFHRTLPRVAQLLPIPRRLDRVGVRRYGFHGLSYQYLMEELRRRVGEQRADGRWVLAHLGAGASLAAVRRGQSIDTTMAFTPTAGIPMATRSGDLDPGLVSFLARTEQMTPDEFHAMVNHQSGMLGVSETSGDMQELLALEATDPRATEAVAMFCYQVKKAIGALTAALGGLDGLVFAGGIGEHAADVRLRICAGLEYLGIELDVPKNEANAAVISRGAVPVYCIATDEQRMIARATQQLLGSL